jgi:hypothetical protein
MYIAGARTTVREGAMLNNVLHQESPCGLGKVLGGSLGAEDRRRGELDGGGPAVAAGAQPPAIVRLGLINKRLEELLWCTRERLGAWVGEDVDRKGVRIGRRQWRTARLGGGCACARGATGAGFYWHWRSVRGSWGQPRCRCTRGVGSKARRRAAVGTPTSGKWPLGAVQAHTNVTNSSTLGAVHGPLGPPVPQRARAARIRRAGVARARRCA